MKRIQLYLLGLLFVGIASSCQDFTQMNINPNGTEPSKANLNFLLTAVETEFAKEYNKMSVEDIAGVMQYIQKDGWGSGTNSYEWNADYKDWGAYYNLIKELNLIEKRALGKDVDSQFFYGISKTMKSWIFCILADLYGDAIYREANAYDQDGKLILDPRFDRQDTVYLGAIEELKAAYTILSTVQNGGKNPVVSSADVFCQASPQKWAKLTATLLLRYGMRISEKYPQVAKAIVEAYYDKGLTSNADNIMMPFIGTSSTDSWPNCGVEPVDKETNFMRIKMASPFVDKMYELKDPRIVIFARRIDIPSEEKDLGSTKEQEEVNGIRYINSNPKAQSGRKIKKYSPDTYVDDERSSFKLYDLSPTYVGFPVGSNEGAKYNLFTSGDQNTNLKNPYVSRLREDIWMKPKGDFLEARMATFAEVSFILAEAKFKGWNVGSMTAEQYYKQAITASFGYWLPSKYQGDAANYSHVAATRTVETYMAQESVKWNNSLERIMEQKWINGFNTAFEVWRDYCRTGYPELKAGTQARKNALPIRFPYSSQVIARSMEKSAAAIKDLQKSIYSDTENDPWSKPLILQGTNKPW